MAEQENLNNSLIVSTCLHVGVLLFMFFGMPSFFKPLPTPQNWRPIPVDIVEIGEITNTRILGQEEAASAPRPPSKPTPAAEEKAPETPKPPVKVETKPPEAKMEETDLAAILKKHSKPKTPEPAKQQQAPDQLTSVLKNIAKLKPSAAPEEETKQNDSTTNGPGGVVKPGATTGGFGPALSDRLTITAEDALRRQISGCWNMPVGARNAEELIVEVLIEVNPDRTVAKAEIIDQTRMASDTYFRAAAESALRALKNPRCSPLELPPDDYERWKSIRFTFDPRDML